MNLLRRDLKPLNLYKPTIERDGDGDKYNAYEDVHATFKGNVQPYSEDKTKQDYGLDLRYAYMIYTQSTADFKELDRVGKDKPQYEIKVIQKWDDYTRLLVEEVKL